MLPPVTSLCNIGYSYTVYTLCVYAWFMTYVFINTYASISLGRLVQTFDLECSIVTIHLLPVVYIDSWSQQTLMTCYVSHINGIFLSICKLFCI